MKLSHRLAARVCTVFFGGLLLFGLVPGASAQAVDWSKKAVQSERSRSFDALHYKITIRLDLDQKSFSGETTISLTALQDRLDTIVLDAEEFTVSKVTSDLGDRLTFEQTEKELKVHLAKPLRRGETRSLTCIYAGQDPKVGLRFMAKTPRNPKLVFSDSFPDHVHHWFPCFDYPNDKATNELIATVKTGLKVASNGRLLSTVSDPLAGTVTYHWSQDKPHSTYLIFFSAAPYVVIPDSYKTIPLNYWVYPQDVSKVAATYGKTTAMMAFFEKTFGVDYPWQKYDQVSVPSGGGAESTSATAMTQDVMVDAQHEADFSPEMIVSHELAHHWWGDLITLRSWGHTWLNESFATYSDYMYSASVRGNDEGDLNLLGKMNAYLREAKTRYIRPIVTDRYDKPGDMFDSHTYPKGARVIHMLRNLLGDDAFFATLKHFLTRHSFDSVDTNDFIRSVKTVTGQNLDWFFDQWLYKLGHPVFDVKSEWVPERKVMRLRVAQVQDFTKGIPVYKIPVEIALVSNGQRSSKTVWIHEKEHTFEFRAETKPSFVKFDVGNVLLKEINFSKDVDELLSQLRGDDGLGRMDAASQLARFKDNPRVFAALAASAEGDAFWAVRRSAVEAIGGFADNTSRPILLKTCLDPHSSVRTSSLAILGNRKDRRLAELFRDRFAKDESDLAKAESLRALGKTGDTMHIPFLEKIVTVSSFRNILGNAATQALKMLGKQNQKSSNPFIPASKSELPS